MCRVNKKKILLDKIAELTDTNNTLESQINTLTVDKSKTDSCLEDLQTKLNTFHNAVNEQVTINNTLTDKIVELETDIEDKHDLIEQLNNKYSHSSDINQQLVDKLKEDITKLIHDNTLLKKQIPKNTVLYYFVGSNYNQNHSSFVSYLKQHFKNTFDSINIEFDRSMYDTLKNIKMCKDVQKIRTSKKSFVCAFDNISRDLNNGKKIVLIGENYGGAVINRIIDKLTSNKKNGININYLSNIFCITFGSFYCPNRTSMPQKFKKFFNKNTIKNYIYKGDYSANYDVGIMPDVLTEACWTDNVDNFTRWGISDKIDPLEIHYSYKILPIVNDALKDSKFIDMDNY